MSIATVREAVATALRDGCSINATPYLASKIRPPHAMVSYKVTYDMTMARGADEYLFTVSVYAQRDNEIQSQKLLDRLSDPHDATGVKQILEGDSGVAGVVDYIRVASTGDLQVVEIGSPGVQYLTVEFVCEVAIST